MVLSVAQKRDQQHQQWNRVGKQVAHVGVQEGAEQNPQQTDPSPGQDSILVERQTEHLFNTQDQKKHAQHYYADENRIGKFGVAFRLQA